MNKNPVFLRRLVRCGVSLGISVIFAKVLNNDGLILMSPFISAFAKVLRTRFNLRKMLI